jgi:hypothetical protein
LRNVRRAHVIAFVTCAFIFTSFVFVPELFGSGKTKDYPTWFWVAERYATGQDFYVMQPGAEYEFLYPPFAALLIAAAGALGKYALYGAFVLATTAAWCVSLTLSNRFAGLDAQREPWLAATPALLTLPGVFDAYDLGQPNLLLLGLMLVAFLALRMHRQWSAGLLFAAAIAIKAFPIAVVPYLLWRRQWTCLVATAAFLVVFLLALPTLVRGYDRNIQDLKTWYDGMVVSAGEKGFGQRAEQNWGWRNQSLIAMVHRVVRPVNYEAENLRHPPAYINVVDLSYTQANALLGVIALGLGLAFVCAMPRREERTAESDAEEWGILLALMTIATPLARQYYFVWLMLPYAVLLQRAAHHPSRNVRRLTTGILAASTLLMALSLPVFPHWVQAAGNNFFATLLIIAGLVICLVSARSSRSRSAGAASAVA